MKLFSHVENQKLIIRIQKQKKDHFFSAYAISFIFSSHEHDNSKQSLKIDLMI